MASLGDISGLVEEDGTTTATDGGSCQHSNETASNSDSLGIRELTEDDSDAVNDSTYADQCQSILSKDVSLNSQVSNNALTSHLHFGWRWRTFLLSFIGIFPSLFLLH